MVFIISDEGVAAAAGVQAFGGPELLHGLYCTPSHFFWRVLALATQRLNELGDELLYFRPASCAVSWCSCILSFKSSLCTNIAEFERHTKHSLDVSHKIQVPNFVTNTMGLMTTGLLLSLRARIHVRIGDT